MQFDLIQGGLKPKFSLHGKNIPNYTVVKTVEITAELKFQLVLACNHEKSFDHRESWIQPGMIFIPDQKLTCNAALSFFIEKG